MQNIGVVRNQISSTGYTVLDVDCLEDVIGFVARLGPITADARNPDPYRRIRPQTLDRANPNTLSSRYGTGRFPFHTDAAHWKVPPEYVILFCEASGSGERPTELIDTHRWVLTDQAQDEIVSGVWKIGHWRPRLGSVGTKSNGRLEIRYDDACMHPMNARARKLRDLLHEVVGKTTPEIVKWTRGKLLIIDNRRILHARGAAHAEDSDRILIRILVGGAQ